MISLQNDPASLFIYLGWVWLQAQWQEQQWVGRDELKLIQDIHPGGSNPDKAEEEEEGKGLFGDDMIKLTSFLSFFP